MKLGTVAEMRQVDAQTAEDYGLPCLLLMENAGAAVARHTAELLGGAAGKYIVLLAGSGNNGGDALCAARHLANLGAQVHIFLAGEVTHLKTDAKVMYEADQSMELGWKATGTGTGCS